MTKRAVILLSGGLDSATTLAVARGEGYDGYALSFDYGQRHGAELNAARAVAAQLGAHEHRVMTLDLGQFGGSALTDRKLAVPEQASATVAACSAMPVTLPPSRAPRSGGGSWTGSWTSGRRSVCVPALRSA